MLGFSVYLFCLLQSGPSGSDIDWDKVSRKMDWPGKQPQGFEEWPREMLGTPLGRSVAVGLSAGVAWLMLAVVIRFWRRRRRQESKARWQGRF